MCPVRCSLVRQGKAGHYDNLNRGAVPCLLQHMALVRVERHQVMLHHVMSDNRLQRAPHLESLVTSDRVGDPSKVLNWSQTSVQASRLC